MESDDSKNNVLSSLQALLKLSYPVPGIKTASLKTNRWVTVTGDSLLKGIEGSICRLDPLLRGVHCLPRTWVKDVKRKLPALAEPSDKCLLLAFQVGSDDTARNLRASRETSGPWDSQGSGAQVMFSILPAAGNDEGRNGKSQMIYSWLPVRCHRQKSGAFDHGLLTEQQGCW